MKNWIIRIFILLFYLIPYMFLSMNEDAASGTMWFYLLMIVAFVILSYISKKTNNRRLVIIGNICSLLVSLVCLFRFRTEKWDWYFKPLTDIQLMITVSVIAFIIQLRIVFHRKKNEV